MRLFVAVNFSENFRLRIARLIEEIRKQAERGNFTRIQNLHMTLQFIGETDRMEEAAAAVSAVDFGSFKITFDRLSGFRRQGTEISWLGVSDSGELKKLAGAVGDKLKAQGFRLEDRPFVAHLTLGREVVFKKGFEPKSIALPSGLTETVDRISLMKSERLKGVLTYTEIGVKEASVNKL